MLSFLIGALGRVCVCTAPVFVNGSLDSGQTFITQLHVETHRRHKHTSSGTGEDVRTVVGEGGRAGWTDGHVHDRTCTSCEVTRVLMAAQTSERRPRPIFIQAYECAVFVCVSVRARVRAYSRGFPFLSGSK